MTVKETAAFLRAHDDYLILTHMRPDGDTLGSGSALCRILKEMGKTAWMLKSEDAIRIFHSYLEGCEAPEGYVPKTVVSVDTASESLFPPNAEEYKGKVHLSIDHHPSNTGYAAHTWVEPEYAACGELIYELAEELGVRNSKIGRLLYLAIATDTGSFLYSNTSPRTHRAAAALMEWGADVYPINKLHFRTKSLKRLKLESALVRDMELYQNDTIAVAAISLDLLNEVGATSEDLDDIGAFIGQLEGVLHSITVRERESGECKMSLRTNEKLLDAGAVCALLGGGGHAAAAGCTVRGTVREAIDAMLAAVEQVQRGCV